VPLFSMETIGKANHISSDWATAAEPKRRNTNRINNARISRLKAQKI